MRFFSFLLFLTMLPASLLITSCQSSDDDSGTSILSSCADTVVDAPGDPGEGNREAYENSDMAVNGVRGGGDYSGSLDVFSINRNSSDGYVILRWSDRKVTNGDGFDFVVFENPYIYTSSSTGERFMEQIVVSLSIDGTNWVEFPHEYTYPNWSTLDSDEQYSDLPQYWTGFAGVKPVLYNEDDNKVDIEDAGGDQFDLDDLQDVVDDESEDSDTRTLAQNILNNGFVYIKLTDASVDGYPVDSNSWDDTADVDGVYGRYLDDDDISGE